MCACLCNGNFLTGAQNGMLAGAGFALFQSGVAAGAADVQVDAGVAEQLVLGDPTAPRFVYWDKKLRPTPSGQPVSQPNRAASWHIGMAAWRSMRDC